MLQNKSETDAIGDTTVETEVSMNREEQNSLGNTGESSKDLKQENRDLQKGLEELKERIQEFVDEGITVGKYIELIKERNDLLTRAEQAERNVGDLESRLKETFKDKTLLKDKIKELKLEKPTSNTEEVEVDNDGNLVDTQNISPDLDEHTVGIEYGITKTNPNITSEIPQKMSRKNLNYLNEESGEPSEKDVNEKPNELLIQNLQKEISESQNKIQELDGKLKELQDLHLESKKHLKEALKEIKNSKQELTKKEEDIKSLKTQLLTSKKEAKFYSPLYKKYHSTSKNLNEKLSALKLKYSGLKNSKTKAIDQRKEVMLQREADMTSYNYLRQEYTQLYKSYTSLTEEAGRDTVYYNGFVSGFEDFKAQVKEQKDKLIAECERVIDNNIAAYEDYKRDIDDNIYQYNTKISTKWEKNIEVNQENTEFIKSLQKAIGEINRNSEDDINDNKEKLNDLTRYTVQVFNEIKEQYPKIQEEYTCFLNHKAKDLNEMNQNQDELEKKVSDTSSEREHYNMMIRTTILTKQDEILDKIELTKAKLSALQCIEDKVKGKEEEYDEMKGNFKMRKDEQSIFKEIEYEGCSIVFIKQDDLNTQSSSAITIPFNEQLRI